MLVSEQAVQKRDGELLHKACTIYPSPELSSAGGRRALVDVDGYASAEYT